MAGMEIFLDGDDTLDGQIGVLSGVIDDTLSRFQEANPNNIPINPAVYVNKRILHIADVFAAIAGARTSEEETVAARGALFAREIAIILYGDDVTLAPVDDVVPDDTPEEEVGTVVATESKRYRGQRPNLDMLIRKYYQTIDPEGLCKELVEDVISLICLLAERADAEQRAGAWLEEL